MKRTGIIFLVAVLSLALLSGGALAKDNPGKGNKPEKAAVKGASEKVNPNKGKAANGQSKVIKKAIKETVKKNVAVNFKDATDHWAKNAMEKVQNYGLVKGYEDGTFKPDDPVTEAEAMVMVVNLAEILTADEDVADIEEDEEIEENDGDTEDEASDVPAWAREKAQKAAKLKIINLNRFHSHVQASRAQAAIMLAKALGLQPASLDSESFGDVALLSIEDVGYILALQKAGIIKGTPDGKFNPNSAVTRAEMAAMLAAIVDVVEEQDGEDNDSEETTTEDENEDSTEEVTSGDDSEG